jgi:hypothetical protein
VSLLHPVRLAEFSVNFFFSVVATVLGLIPASSNTVESEGRQMKQCRNHTQNKNEKNSPLNNSWYYDNDGKYKTTVTIF